METVDKAGKWQDLTYFVSKLPANERRTLTAVSCSASEKHYVTTVGVQGCSQCITFQRGEGGECRRGRAQDGATALLPRLGGPPKVGLSEAGRHETVVVVPGPVAD